MIAGGAAGVLCAGLAVVACWQARDSRAVRLLLAVVVALAWATPGPVVGAGLKSAIESAVDFENAIYGARAGRGCCSVQRAVAVARRLGGRAAVLPVCRRAGLAGRPVGAATADGHGPRGRGPAGGELRHAVWPLAAAAAGRAAVAVGVLALGEFSASKLVATPGDYFVGETFAHIVWARMHYGVANNLAALCLLLAGGHRRRRRRCSCCSASRTSAVRNLMALEVGQRQVDGLAVFGAAGHGLGELHVGDAGLETA